MYNVYLLCLSVVNIYQNCYIWLSLMEGKRERKRETFSLPSKSNEGVGVSALFSPQCPVPIAKPYTSVHPGLTHSPSFWGSSWGLLPLPIIHFHSLQHSSVFFSSAKVSRKRQMQEVMFIKKINLK